MANFDQVFASGTTSEAPAMGTSINAKNTKPQAEMVEGAGRGRQSMRLIPGDK
jgi:hypothetical protein